MQFENLIAVVLAGNDEDPCVFGGVGQASKFFLPFDCERSGIASSGPWTGSVAARRSTLQLPQQVASSILSQRDGHSTRRPREQPALGA